MEKQKSVLVRELERLSEHTAHEHAARLRADLRFQKLIDAIERTYQDYGGRCAAGELGVEREFVGALAAVMEIYADLQLPTWSQIREQIQLAQATK